MRQNSRPGQRDTLKAVHTVYIGLGANLPGPAGSPPDTLAAAAARIGATGRIISMSSVYATDPVGYSDQPKFVNAALALETDLEAQKLLQTLLVIEREFGRDRTHAIPNGPRTLDLDILLIDDSVIDERDLNVPHPRLAERAFVLMPLSEIAPGAIDPRSGKTVSELLRSLFASSGESASAAVKIHAKTWDALAEKIAAGK